MRSLSSRYRPPGGGALPVGGEPTARHDRRRDCATQRDRLGDEGLLDLRPRPDCVQRRRIRRWATRPVRGGEPMTTLITPKRKVELTIDERTVTVPEGTTILDACKGMGLAIPTLCYLETLHPINACRVCVVEVEGSRVLVPSCARAVERGMVVRTNTDRVRHSRKMILEFLASSVDLSTTPDVATWLTEYECQPARYGPPAPPAANGCRDLAPPGHH